MQNSIGGGATHDATGPPESLYKSGCIVKKQKQDTHPSQKNKKIICRAVGNEGMIGMVRNEKQGGREAMVKGGVLKRVHLPPCGGLILDG